MSDATKAGSGVEEAQGSGAAQAPAGTAAPEASPAAPAPAPAAPEPDAAPVAAAPVTAAAVAAEPAAGAPAPAPAAEPAKRKAAPVVLAAVSDADAQGEIKKLRDQLLETRQALRQREAELEVSQEMSRSTLAKLKDQHERTLRAVADLDNHKKRVVKEREEHAKFGQEKLLKDLLPVLDNFDRALEHAKTASDLEAVKSGFGMMRKLFEDTLGRHGVKGFSAMGTHFDPKLHEAIQTVESDQPPGTVVVEVVRGFMLHDRLMRPAMVGVAKPKAEQPKPAAQPSAIENPGASSVGEPDKPAPAEGTAEPEKS